MMDAQRKPVPSGRVERGSRAGRTVLLALTCAAVVVCGISAAGATDYYVRTDGNDSCNGRGDSGGSSGTCAFRTIERCVNVAGCGDTCHVRDGEFFEDPISLSAQCSSSQPLRIIGNGSTRTTWFAGLVEVTDCAQDVGQYGPDAWRCDVPSGANASTGDYGQCFQQALIEPVYQEDEQRSKGHLTEFMCLTPHGSTSGVQGEHGTYTIVDGGAGYLIHGWSGEGADVTSFYAPASGVSSGTIPVRIGGRNIVIEGFEVLSGADYSIGFAEDRDCTVRDLEVFGGTFVILGGSYGATVEDVVVRNNYRRPYNGTGQTDEAWNRNSQSAFVQGHDFTIRNFEAYASREGVGFSGNAGPGTVDGLKIHWHHNHNFKFQGTAHDITVTNCWTYNTGVAQEAIFIAECAQDIEISHCTLASESVSIHDNHQDGQQTGPTCPDQDGDGTGEHGPAGIEFYNNVMPCVIWLNSYGDPRSNPNWKFDYNVYLDDWDNFGCRAFHHRDVRRDRDFTTLSAWQNWSSDPCTGDCIRDPNSTVSRTAAEFLDYAYQDDTSSASYSFDLREGASSVDFGNPDFAPPSGLDIEKVSRVGRPDTGGWEREGSGGSTACSDGVDNDGDGQVDLADANCTDGADDSESQCGDGVAEGTAEVCDGTDLDGETCQSQGFEGGDLACQSDCQGYDTSDCVENTPPSDVENLRRDDVR
jgi:hypothetical protein